MPTSTRRLVCLLTTAAGLAACASSPLQPTPIEVTRAFAIAIAPTDHTLEVCVPCGTVVIAHADAPTCEVEAHAVAPTRAEAEALAAQIEPVTDARPAGVCLAQLGIPAAADLGTRVVVAVHAPPTLRVLVRTRRAAVAVHGFRGDVDIDSDSGTVSTRMDGGNLQVRTVSGTIRTQGRFATARLRTETGDVHVTVTGEPGELGIETTSGEVRLDCAPTARLTLDVRTRGVRALQCDVPVRWSENARDDGQRWRRYVGTLGDLDSGDGLRVSLVAESGRVVLRGTPGT